METLEYHELADAFPLMLGDDFAELVADIRERGLIEPITTHEGKILDGRNRYRACMEADTEPRFQVWAGEHGSIVAFVWARNGLRRNLDVGQRAVIALAFLPQLEADAKARHDKLSGSRSNPGEAVPISVQPPQPEPKGHASRSVAAAARQVGVGKTSVTGAKRLSEAAKTDTKAAQNLERVRAGTMKLNSAVQQLTRVARLPAPGAKSRDEQPDSTIIPIPNGWQSAHPAEMLVAALGGLRRDIEKQAPITEGVLAAWWDGIEWREWHAAKGDVIWFRDYCMPLLHYVFTRRNRTPPMVRMLKAIDAPPKQKKRA